MDKSKSIRFLLQPVAKDPKPDSNIFWPPLVAYPNARIVPPEEPTLRGIGPAGEELAIDSYPVKSQSGVQNYNLSILGMYNHQTNPHPRYLGNLGKVEERTQNPEWVTWQSTIGGGLQRWRAHYGNLEYLDLFAFVGPSNLQDFKVGLSPFINTVPPLGCQQSITDQHLRPVVLIGVGPCASDVIQNIMQLVKEKHEDKNYFICVPHGPVSPITLQKVLELLIAIATSQVVNPVSDLSVGAAPTTIGASTITIVRGEKLLAADLSGKSDPFCKFYFGPKLGVITAGPFQTKAKSQTLNPVWGPNDRAKVECNFAKYIDSQLIIEVWDEDVVGADRLGFCEIAVAQLRPGEIELPLKPMKKEKATGKLFIKIS